MKKLFLVLLCVAAVTAVDAKEKSDKEKKDWGYLTGSFESTDHIYVKDVANSFYPSEQVQLGEDGFIASNNYLKLDYNKGRLSAGMQLEGYFPSLVGYPIPTNALSLSNLYATWRDKSWSVTAGSFYEQQVRQSQPRAC